MRARAAFINVEVNPQLIMDSLDWALNVSEVLYLRDMEEAHKLLFRVSSSRINYLQICWLILLKMQEIIDTVGDLLSFSVSWIGTIDRKCHHVSTRFAWILAFRASSNSFGYMKWY
jgi:hypothetical protein